jgi:hypothetical protein
MVPVIKSVVHNRPVATTIRINTVFSSDDATKALRNWLRPGGVADAKRVQTVNSSWCK